jgi:diaminopimelate epimerase
VRVPFCKLQAAGNGYVAIDGRERSLDWPDLARAIAEPNFGVGSDGLLVVLPATRPDAALRMRVFNSDGSEAEMSGNGIRLFAKFALDRGMAAAEDGVLRVETAAGLREVWPRMFDGRMVSARVSMGVPSFEPAALPVDGVLAGGAERLVDHPLELDGRRLPITCLSIGNPHAVALIDEPVEEFPLAELGPLVQNHALFPQRVNFEVANVLGSGLLRARIFERGEGETLASGTGSTACVVAARLHGRVAEQVEVVLPGGRLNVTWQGEGAPAFLEGPAVEVFEGEWLAASAAAAAKL